MSSQHDIEQVLAAVEDARRVLGGSLAGGADRDEALECLKSILDDAAMVRSLSRIRRRPIARLTS